MTDCFIRRRAAFLLASLVGLGGCFAGDETISGYVDPETQWQLRQMDDHPQVTQATVQFPKKGQVVGSGPCNTFSARQTAPYPWIDISVLASTRRACPQLADEQKYFSTLGAMTLAEVSGDILILSNDEGQTLVFQAVLP